MPKDLIWDGRTLEDGPVAIHLVTAEGSDSAPPTLILAAVAAGDEKAILPADHVRQFLLAHRDCSVICADAGVFHRVLESTFKREGEQEALGVLWELSRTACLVDILLLNHLVQMAGADWPANAVDLTKAIEHQSRLGIEKPQSLAHEIVQSGAIDLGGLDASLLRGVIAIASGMLKAYESLEAKARHAAKSAGVAPHTIAEYGPLGLGLHVQGAVALAHAEGSSLLVDQQRRTSLVTELRAVQERYCQQLAQDRRVRACFKIDDGGIRLRDHMPEVNQDRLQSWLFEESEGLAGPYGLPLPFPHAPGRRTSTVPDYWGVLGECHPMIRAWCQLHAVSRSLQLLDRLRSTPIRNRCEILPRLATDPPQTVLEHLGGRGLFRSPEEHVFVIARLPDLEYRALAAVWEDQYGHSALADVFRRGDEDMFGVVGRHLADANPDVRLELTEIDTADRWRQIAGALMTALGLKLGNENARKLLQGRLGLNLFPDEVGRLVEALVGLFPELGAHNRDDTLQQLSSWLGLDEQTCRRELAGHTSTEIRRSIAGYRAGAGVFNKIAKIDQEQGYGVMPLQGISGPELYEEVFGCKFRTLTGRVRHHQLYSEESAEHLVLADDAVKAMLYVITASGYRLAAVVSPEIVVTVPSDRATEACHRIAELAGEAAGDVLGKVPGVCQCSVQDCW